MTLELYTQKHLRVRSCGIICLHMDHVISDCTISFIIRSLQVGGGFKTLISKEISRSNIVPYWFPRINSLDGLIYLRGGHDFHVFNPTTGEFVSLPVLSYPCPFPDSRMYVILSGFGYCLLKVWTSSAMCMEICIFFNIGLIVFNLCIWVIDFD